MPIYTFINGDTGEIISWGNFHISSEEINEFNKVVKEYSKTTKIIPNTWELVDICFKNGHLKVPTLKELQSVSSLKKEIITNKKGNYILYKKEFIEETSKKPSFITKIYNMLITMFCIIFIISMIFIIL